MRQKNRKTDRQTDGRTFELGDRHVLLYENCTNMCLFCDKYFLAVKEFSWFSSLIHDVYFLVSSDCTKPKTPPKIFTR